MRITKEAREAREDKRDIMPDCVIEVGPSSKSINYIFRRRRYPSHDSFYRDYFSTTKLVLTTK